MPVVFITSGASFVVPADCNKFDWIDCIGEGGNGLSGFSPGYGAGGGAWSRVNNFSVTPSSTIFCQVGTGSSLGSVGKDTWINKTTNAAPTSTADGCLAKGGGASNKNGTASVGGKSSSGVGDQKYSGGNSNISSTGGGGGAAGPSGNGGNAFLSNGGSGDAGSGGVGGGPGGGGFPGKDGAEYDASHGSGGGGGGSGSTAGSGGKYGGGAGGGVNTGKIGGPGLIAYSYTPVKAVPSFNIPMLGM